VYPICSEVILKTFYCTEADGRYFLVADLSKECYTREWLKYAVVAMVGVALYPVGILLYSGSLLFRNRHKLYTSKKMIARYSILFVRYEPEFYFWECTELARKLLLTSVIIFCYPGTLTQVCTALTIAACFTIIHLKYCPFDEDPDDTLQSFSLIATLVTFGGAILLFGPENDPAKISMMIIVVNAAVLGVAAMIFYYFTWPRLKAAYRNHLETMDELSAFSSLLGKKAPAESPETAQLVPEDGCEEELELGKAQEETNPLAEGKGPPKESPPASPKGPNLEIVRLVNELYGRYDIDGSGTLNTPDEVRMLSFNVFYKLGINIPDRDFDIAFALLGQIDDRNAMDRETYSSWFEENFT